MLAPLPAYIIEWCSQNEDSGGNARARQPQQLGLTDAQTQQTAGNIGDAGASLSISKPLVRRVILPRRPWPKSQARSLGGNLQAMLESLIKSRGALRRDGS